MVMNGRVRWWDVGVFHFCLNGLRTEKGWDLLLCRLCPQEEDTSGEVTCAWFCWQWVICCEMWGPPFAEQGHAGSVPWSLTLHLAQFCSLLLKEWKREQCDARAAAGEELGNTGKTWDDTSFSLWAWGIHSTRLWMKHVLSTCPMPGSLWWYHMIIEAQHLHYVVAKSLTLNPNSTTCWLGDIRQVT